MKIVREALYPLIAVAAAFVIGGIIILLIGENPFVAFRLLVENSFISAKGIFETLHYATPLIFTGLAVAIAFRCGLLNIGAEGQLYVAAFACAWVGIKFGGTIVTVGDVQQDWSWASLPAFILVPMCIAAAVIAGSFWGFIPGYLKAKFGSHEVINTIMLNFIAIALVSYFTQYYFKEPGDPILQTVPIGDSAWIPQLHTFLPFVPEDVPLNVAFILALVMCAAMYVFLWKTKWGYELRAVGENPSAAEYGGISPKKQIIIAMTISGSLAGMVAIGEVLGFRHNYYHGFSAEWGFWGIAVALLGRNHPVGVLLAAIFFGMLLRGGIFVDAFTEYISKDLVEVLQAIIILFVASMQKFSK
ncbi:MAG: ABC transporter permease [Acidobacteria bacterium]|nr:MAG: ABC transporter permease [Acidobacteriota bacterium]REK04026.1 MAG: ABC transporter permease [Acidobacteriota bacterium]REK15188.1 MAG: ABC transporter permease [Acidobacteriota bacterium]REK46278.1 MAG: ABC transporter permease [Acidobacteriota bacterium]